MNLLSIEISCYKRRFNICLLVSLASYYLWLPLTPTLYLPMLSGLHKVKKLDFLLFVLHVVVLRKKNKAFHHSEKAFAVSYLFHPQCIWKEPGQDPCVVRGSICKKRLLKWVDLWVPSLKYKCCHLAWHLQHASSCLWKIIWIPRIQGWTSQNKELIAVLGATAGKMPPPQLTCYVILLSKKRKYLIWSRHFSLPFHCQEVDLAHPLHLICLGFHACSVPD